MLAYRTRKALKASEDDMSHFFLCKFWYFKSLQCHITESLRYQFIFQFNSLFSWQFSFIWSQNTDWSGLALGSSGRTCPLWWCCDCVCMKLSDRWSLLSAIGWVLLVSVERFWWFPLFTAGMVWCSSVRRPCSRREGSETSIYLLEPVPPPPHLSNSQYISVFSSGEKLPQT